MKPPSFRQAARVLGLPSVMAIGLSCLAIGAVAEPEPKPKPKDGMVVGAGEESQASLSTSTQASEQGGDANHIGLLHGANIKAAKAKTAKHPGGANKSKGDIPPPEKP